MQKQISLLFILGSIITIWLQYIIYSTHLYIIYSDTFSAILIINFSCEKFYKI